MGSTRPAAERIVQAWIDRLRDLDLEGFLDLYAPEACLETKKEILRGRDELAERLASQWRRLRGMELEAGAAVQQRGDSVTFETTLKAWIGELRLRHSFVLESGAIRQHQMDVVEWRKPLPQWNLPGSGAPTPAMA